MSEDDPSSLFAGRRGRRAKQQQTSEDGTPIQPILTQEEQERIIAVTSVQRHLAELQPHDNVTLQIIDDLSFEWSIVPQDGLWKGVKFLFHVSIPNNFPYSSPIVVLKTPIWHPNIDLDGKPCVSVLQKGWRPTHTLNYLMFGLLYLFEHPNSEDPLNIKAADEMRTNLSLFKQNVADYLKKAASR